MSEKQSSFKLAHVRWVISDVPAGEGPGKFWSKASGWSSFIIHAVIYPSQEAALADVASRQGRWDCLVYVIRVRVTIEEVIE